MDAAPERRVRAEVRRAVRVVLLLVVATRVGAWAAGNGASWFWPPAAVMVLYLFGTRRLGPRSALAAAGVLLLGRWVASLPEVLGGVDWWIAVATGAPVVAAYTTAAVVLRRGNRRFGFAGLKEQGAFLALFVLAAPALAAVGSRLVVAGIGIRPLDWAEVGAFALGDALAVATIVPLAVGFWRGRHRAWPLPQRAWSLVLAGLTGAAVPMAASGALPAGFGPFLLAAPMIVAASVAGRLGASAVGAVGGVALFVLAATDPDKAALLDVKPLFLATVLLSQALAAALHESVDRRPEPAPPRERTIDVHGGTRSLPTLDGLHRRVERGVRGVRLVGALLLVTRVSIATPDEVPGHIGMLVLVPVATLLAANAYSHDRSRAGDHGRTRRRTELAIDLVTAVSLHLLLEPVIPAEPLPRTLVAFAVLAAVRLPMWEALTATFVALVAITGPWLVGDVAIDALDLVSSAVILAVLAGVVGVVVNLLQAQREEALAVAEEIADAQRELAAQREVLSHDRDALAAQARRLRDLVAERDAANDELRRSRDALEGFAAVVAHDLAAPLGSARILAGTIVDRSLPEAQRTAFAGRIGESIDRSLALVHRLHAQARAQAAPLDVRPVDGNVLLRDVVDDHRAQVDALGATVDVRSFLPRLVVDPVLLRQALSNLLGNALRHGAADGHVPTVTIDAMPHDDGLHVTVADDGPGLDPVVRDQLARNVGIVSEQGLGLGLMTARGVIERHGGRLWAHGRPDGRRGAAFSLVLPMPRRARATVLVVDDAHDVRRLLSLAFRRELGPAVRVHEAADLATARRLLGDVAPDLVLLDLGLGEENGLDLLADARRLGVPVHVLTAADPSDAAVLQATAHGVRIHDKADLVRLAGALAGWLMDQLGPEADDGPGPAVDAQPRTLDALRVPEHRVGRTARK